MVRKVLLASDASPSALAAARWTAGLAEQLGGLTAMVLHVFQLPGPYVAMGIDGTVVVPPLPDDEETRNAVQPIFDATIAAFGQAPLVAATRLERGVPADSIVAVAHEGEYDAVVLGNRGLNPLAHLLMGSVSERVLRLCRCPVVIIKN